MDFSHPDLSLLDESQGLLQRMTTVEDASRRLVGELEAQTTGAISADKLTSRFELNRVLHFKPLEIWRSLLGRKMVKLQDKLQVRIAADRNVKLDAAQLRLAAAALWEPDLTAKVRAFHNNTDSFFELDRLLLGVWRQLEQLSEKAKHVVGIDALSGAPTPDSELVGSFPMGTLPRLFFPVNVSANFVGRFPSDEVDELGYAQAILRTWMIISLPSFIAQPDDRDTINVPVGGDENPWDDLSIEMKLDGEEVENRGVAYMKAIREHLGADSAAARAFRRLGLPHILDGYARRIYFHAHLGDITYTSPRAQFQMDTISGSGACQIETTIDLVGGRGVRASIHARAILRLPCHRVEVWFYPKLAAAEPVVDEAEPSRSWSDRCRLLIAEMEAYREADADNSRYVEAFRDGVNTLREETASDDDDLLGQMGSLLVEVGVPLVNKVKGHQASFRELREQWEMLVDGDANDTEAQAKALIATMEQRREWWKGLEPTVLSRVEPYRGTAFTPGEIELVAQSLGAEEGAVEAAIGEFTERTDQLAAELEEVRTQWMELAKLREQIEYNLAQRNVQRVWGWMTAPMVTRMVWATGASTLSAPRSRPSSTVDDAGWEVVERPEPLTTLTINWEQLDAAPSRCESAEAWRRAAESHDRFIATLPAGCLHEAAREGAWEAALGAAFLFHVQGEAVPITHSRDLDSNTDLLTQRISELFDDRDQAAETAKLFKRFCAKVPVNHIENAIQRWFVADWVAFSEVRQARRYRFEKGDGNAVQMHAFTYFKFHTKPDSAEVEELGYVMVNATWDPSSQQVEIRFSKRFEQEPVTLPSYEKFDGGRAAADANEE
jgi:hypothetical protein